MTKNTAPDYELWRKLYYGDHYESCQSTQHDQLTVLRKQNELLRAKIQELEHENARLRKRVGIPLPEEEGDVVL